LSTKSKPSLVAALLLLAVVVPRVAAGALSADDYFDRGDRNWDAMARGLLEGEGLRIPHVGAMATTQYAHKTPVFAFVLAGIYGTLGRHAFPVIAVQVVFALAATWCVFLLAARLTGNRKAAWIAAFATALYPPLVVHDVQVMETTLYRGLVALLTLLVYEAGREPRTRTLLLTGLVAGVTVLTRTTIVFFLPLAAIWLLVMFGRRTPRLLPAVGGALVIFLAVLAPWFARNYGLFHRLHLVTGGGRSYWIGTGEPFLRGFPETSVDIAERQLWRRLPRDERERLRAMNEVELDDALRALAREDLDGHPGRMRTLVVTKAGAAFSPVMNPRDERDDLDRRWGRWKRLVYSLSYGPLLLLGLLGMVKLLVRRFPAATLLLLQYVAFLAFSVLFWAHSRHRYFLDELLAVAAASLFVSLAAGNGDRVRGLPARDDRGASPPSGRARPRSEDGSPGA
jgi:hypothetical protein